MTASSVVCRLHELQPVQPGAQFVCVSGGSAKNCYRNNIYGFVYHGYNIVFVSVDQLLLLLLLYNEGFADFKWGGRTEHRTGH